MNNMILINFYIVFDDFHFECYLSKYFSLIDNFKLVNKMLEKELFTDYNIYVDNDSGSILNPLIALNNLNIYNGMTINVY